MPEHRTCPKCRSARLATVEHLTAIAPCTFDANGNPEYGGGEMEVDWDSCRTVTSPSGRPRVACRDCGHEWWHGKTKWEQ